MAAIRARHFLPGSNARHNSTLILPAALYTREQGTNLPPGFSVTMQRVSFEVGRPSWLPPHLSKQMLQNLERLKPLALLLLRISLGAILIFYVRANLLM